MKTKWWVLGGVMVVAVVLAGSAVAAGNSGPARSSSPDLLFLGSSTALTAVQPASGRTAYSLLDAVPSPDWSHLFHTTMTGVHNRLADVDPTTGAELRSQEVDAG